MEIRTDSPREQEKTPSIIEIKNKIRLDHSECCNCCCCKTPVYALYKYVQPEIPKSFRPIRTFYKSDIPLEDATTYRMSFWPGSLSRRQPIRPHNSLATAEGPFTSDTTNNLSYLGNWCIKPQEKILPCVRNLFGRGPIESCTTQKENFVWKHAPRRGPIIYKGNLCMPRGHVEDNTTYKLSFYNSNCHNPVKSFRPIRQYEKSKVPLEDFTTYRLSFFNKDSVEREKHPWQKKPMYQKPTTGMEGCTTYKLSYWPQKAERTKPILQQSEDNPLNKRKCCLENNTTYGLSFFGGDGDKPPPIYPAENKIFDETPVEYDTTNKMSYLPNWCPKPEKKILPCTRDLLGRGPTQKVTTQKGDFTWKHSCPTSAIRPIGNLTLSKCPVTELTTNRLSYIPNCGDCIMPIKSFRPIRMYEPVNYPMDLDTTMQLSYQPIEQPDKVDKPWAKKIPYTKPSMQIDSNTTYDLSFIPPGSLVPCCPENENIKSYAAGSCSPNTLPVIPCEITSNSVGK